MSLWIFFSVVGLLVGGGQVVHGGPGPVSGLRWPSIRVSISRRVEEPTAELSGSVTVHGGQRLSRSSSLRKRLSIQP